MYYFFAGREDLISMLPEGLKICEIGVQKGFFSRILLATKPRELHLVDPWEHQRDPLYKLDAANVEDTAQSDNYALVIRSVGADDRVHIHRGYSNNVLKTLPEKSMDLVYIDGNHTYQGVLSDLYDAKRIAKEGGLILGHDFCSHWRSREGGFGVIGAVVEFCKGSGLSVFGLTCSSEATDHSSSFSTYFISNGGEGQLQSLLLNAFFNSKFGVVELPNSILGSYSHSTFRTKNDTNRYIPSFT